MAGRSPVSANKVRVGEWVLAPFIKGTDLVSCIAKIVNITSRSVTFIMFFPVSNGKANNGFSMSRSLVQIIEKSHPLYVLEKDEKEILEQNRDQWENALRLYHGVPIAEKQQ